MTTRLVRSRRTGLAAPLLLLLSIVVAACGGGAATDTPSGVVRTALDRVAAKDVDSLRALACAGQEDRIRDQLGLPDAVGAELLPGLDAQALIDAVKLDVSEVDVGEAAVDGDVAQVQVSGDITVTFDAAAMRPILRQVLEAQGATMTDAQLDALLGSLEAYGQAVPFDESIRLVREGGAWKICQAS